MRQSTAIHNNSNNNSNNNNGNMNVFSDRTILSALGLGPALSLSDLDIEALLTAFPPTVPSVSSLPSWIDPMLISGGEDGSSDAPLLLDIPFQSNHQQQVFQQHQQHQFTHFSYDNSASTTTAFSSSPISQASPTLSSSAPASPTANCFDPIAFGIQPPVASVHKPSVAVDAFASFASTISASIPNLPTANPSPPPSLCSYTHSLSHALQTDDDTVSITSTSTRAPRPVRHPIGLMFTQAASIPNLPTSNPSPPPSVASYAPSVSYGFQADDDAASICSSSTSAPRPVRHPVGLMLNQAFAAPNAQFGLALRMGHGMVSPAASSVTSSSALGSMEFPFQTSEHQQSKKRQSGKDEPSLALRIDQTPKAPPSIYDPWVRLPTASVAQPLQSSAPSTPTLPSPTTLQQPVAAAPQQPPARLGTFGSTLARVATAVTSTMSIPLRGSVGPASASGRSVGSGKAPVRSVNGDGKRGRADEAEEEEEDVKRRRKEKTGLSGFVLPPLSQMPMGHQMPPLHQIQQQQHLQQPPSQLSTFMQPPGPQPIYHMQPPVPPSSPPNVPVDNTSSPASPRKIRTVRRSIPRPRKQPSTPPASLPSTPPAAAPSSDSNTVHHCPIPTCGKTFPTPHAVKSHLRCHGAATLSCPHCELPFRRNHDLVRHLRSMHDGGRPHQCTGCEKSFARADALRRHRETLSAHRCRGVPRPVKEKGDVEVEA